MDRKQHGSSFNKIMVSEFQQYCFAHKILEPLCGTVLLRFPILNIHVVKIRSQNPVSQLTDLKGEAQLYCCFLGPESRVLLSGLASPYTEVGQLPGPRPSGGPHC